MAADALPPPSPATREPHFLVRSVMATSSFVLRIEKHALTALMLLLITLVLINVTTRYARIPLYWIDEASIYAVVWLTFVGASLMTRLRLDFSVGLLTDRLGPRGVRIARAAGTAGVLVFGLSMLAMCWLWMDPVGLARYGFDVQEYAAETFNFLYTERSQTLEWPIWALKLVLPIFALTMTLHASANLLEDMGLAPRQVFKDFPVATPEMVN